MTAIKLEAVLDAMTEFVLHHAETDWLGNGFPHLPALDSLKDLRAKIALKGRGQGEEGVVTTMLENAAEEPVSAVAALHKLCRLFEDCAVQGICRADQDLVVNALPQQQGQGAGNQASAQQAEIELPLPEGDTQAALRKGMIAQEPRMAAWELSSRVSLLEQVIYQSPNATAVLDRELNYLVRNERWCNSFRKEDGADSASADIPQRWVEACRASLATEQTQFLHEDSLIFPHNNGMLTKRWVNFSSRPWRDDRRELGGVIIYLETVNVRSADHKDEISFRLLANAMPQIVWTADPDGCLDSYNDRWYEFTGFTRGQAGDQSWVPILCEEDKERCFNTWYESVRTGNPYQIEYRFIDPKTGEVRWYLGRAVPVKDEAGRIMKWIGTCTDIHDLKETQRMLMLSQNRINAVVSNCSVTLWAVDKSGRFTFYKGKNAFLLGIDPEKRLGQNFFRVNAGRPESTEAMSRALHGESLEIESSFRDRIFETHMTPTYDDRHEVNGVVGVYIDITERKRQEVELKRWEQYFQHSQCGMVIALSFSAIQQVNGAFAKIHGTKAEDWAGGAILDMYAEAFRPSVPEIMAKLESVGHLTFESVHVRKDGSTFPVLEDATAVKDEHGETLYCVISCIDLTERKESEEERSRLRSNEQAARQASQLKSEFLATMSHEIRTPINGIIGMIDLACDADLGTEERGHLEAAKRSAHALLNIVNNILDLSKIEANRLDIEKIFFPLYHVVEDVYLSWIFPAQEGGNALRLECEALKPWFVCGDPVRLRQVLTNLVSNAVKFTRNGEITMRVFFDPDSLTGRFEVTDTGIGISQDAIEKIFQPFSQADASTTRRFGGTGLGLSISQQLVHRMGGEIQVRSCEGQGSTFSFKLTFSAAEKRSSNSQQQAQQQQGGHRTTENTGGALTKWRVEAAPHPLHILVVDDNHVNQVVTSRILERMGHSTRTAANGVEAVEAVELEEFDLVIMDCHMPEMDGYEATRRIRANLAARGAARHLPIIAMTANALKGEREKCLECGMDDYLCKPVSRARLAATINSYHSSALPPKEAPDDVAATEQVGAKQGEEESSAARGEK